MRESVLTLHDLIYWRPVISTSPSVYRILRIGACFCILCLVLRQFCVILQSVRGFTRIYWFYYADKLYPQGMRLLYLVHAQPLYHNAICRPASACNHGLGWDDHPGFTLPNAGRRALFKDGWRSFCPELIGPLVWSLPFRFSAPSTGS
jgi:hypothetical protein